MKKFAILFFLSTLKYGALAQSFQKKQLDISIGYGLGSTFMKPQRAQSSDLNLSVEYGVSKSISLGFFISYINGTYSYSEKEITTFNNISTVDYYGQIVQWQFLMSGIKGAYHFNTWIKNPCIDLYAGLMLGYNYSHYFLPVYLAPLVYNNIEANSDSIRKIQPHYSPLIYNAFVGCRFRIHEIAGIFVEVGYGITYVNVGCNYKFVFKNKRMTN